MNKLVEKLNGNAGFLGNITTIITIVAMVLAGTFWMDSRIREVGEQVTTLRAEMVELLHPLDKRVSVNETSLKQLPSRDRWRGQDQIIWSHRLEALNSKLALKVPDPVVVIRDRINND